MNLHTQENNMNLHTDMDGYSLFATYIDNWDLTMILIDKTGVFNLPHVFHEWGKIDEYELKDLCRSRLKELGRVTRKSERVIASYKVVRWDGTLENCLFNNVKIIEFKENDHITFMDSRVGTLKANMDSIFLVNKMEHLEDIVSLDELARLYMPAVNSMAQIDLEEMYR